MRIGRNDPCPCGSGKKYKKCCQRKDEEARAAEAGGVIRGSGAAPGSPAAEPGGPNAGAATAGSDGGPRDRVERMGTAGPRLTPYVVAQIAESPPDAGDPRMRALLERHLRDDWTIAKVAAMTTEAIDAQLRAYGVAHTRERFLELARDRRFAWSVSSAWEERDPISCVGKEVDFLGLAACELWKRLLPERPSVEMIDDWMQAGYRLEAERHTGEACDTWWKVWTFLRQRFDAGMRTMDATDRIFSGMQSVFNWSQDFETCLFNAANREPRFAAVGLQYCSEWLAQFTEEGTNLQVNFRRAKAHFHFCLGQITEGEAVLHENLERWPDDPWSYVALADAYSHLFERGPGPPRDDARAIAYLEQGLARGDRIGTDREVLVERLDELRQRAAKARP